MRLILSSSGLLASVLFFGCSAGEPSESAEAAPQAIIGGTVSTDDPAVVQVRAEYNGPCTGTLIAPNVVLTAAHCIDDRPSKVSVWFGTYALQAQPTEWKKARAWHQHPQYPRPYINQGHDCAVVILDQPVTDVAPKPFSRAAMNTSSIGRAARIVGFGMTNGSPQTGSGTKRTLSTQIVEVRDGIVSIGRTGATSCQGDSGGPMFIDEDGVETVAGITSYGEPGCRGKGSYSRTELCSQWIETFIDKAR